MKELRQQIDKMKPELEHWKRVAYELLRLKVESRR
jgi:hypothetical protein